MRLLSSPQLACAAALALLGGAACTRADATADLVAKAEVAGQAEERAGALPGEASLSPWGGVGSPCTVHDDCGADAVCLTEGFPQGFCSRACFDVCPEEEGPAALCANTSQLQGDALVLGEGACLPACDYGRFPGSGCRDQYGCVPLEQAGRPGSIRYACMPGLETPLDGALEELVQARVGFSPVPSADESPRGRSDLKCRVEDGVLLHSPVAGIELSYFAGGEQDSVLASAEMALALAETLGELHTLGVKRLVHMGTYNCRTIRGRAQLSRHGHAAAIDVFGFDLTDGRRVTVKKDWQRKPRSENALLLQDIIERLVASQRWNVVLTPAYDELHHDHLHLEVLPRETDTAALFRRWPKGVAD